MVKIMSKCCPVCSNRYNLFDRLTNPDMCKPCFSSEEQKAVYLKKLSKKTKLEETTEDNVKSLQKELLKFQKSHRFVRWFNLILGITFFTIVLFHDSWNLGNVILKELESGHFLVTVIGIVLIINTIKNWKSTPELDLAENAIRRVG